MGKLSSNKRKTRGSVKRIIIKKSPKCVYCKCENTLFLNIDHKIPLNRGGEDEEKNMQTTCMNCNSLKDNMTHDEFKKYLKHMKGLKDLGMVNMSMGTLHLKLKKAPGIEKINGITFQAQLSKDNENLNPLLNSDGVDNG